MQELLYLSERKLFDMFVYPDRLPGVRARGVDASLSLLGATAKLALTCRNAALAGQCGSVRVR
jgi:hypothetical protein